ncbi:MAG: T9SS type A sorting domain-containing protein [Bacteroidetes bacterium]|nr:T9SS type A sorting domain-containing protein [Bacteroidota bacterium]
MKAKKLLSVTTLFFLFLFNAFSQAPSNDECSGAITISVAPNSGSCGTYSLNVDTWGATQSSASATCVTSSQDDDVWYKFVATGYNAYFSVSNVYNDNGNAAAWRPGFVIYSGSCSSLTQIACNANVASTSDLASVSGLTPGNTYYVRTFLAGSPNSGYFDLCVYTTSLAATPPANDACSNATSVTVGTTCNYTSGTNVNATQSYAPCGGSSALDVWYKFTATATTATISVAPTGSMDIVYQVYTACVSTSTFSPCVDNGSSGTETSVQNGLTIGTQYYVRVYGWSGATGAFNLCIQSAAPSAPANDACANAITLTPGTSCSPTSGTNVNATQTYAACLGSSAKDVWYKFIATAATATITVAPGSNLDAVYQLYTSCSSTSNLGTCVDNNFSQGGTESNAHGSLTVGSTYYIRVYGFNGSADAFTICVASATSSGNPPANDNCSAATTLNVNASCSYTPGNSANATQVYVNCSNGSNAAKDVWYKFVATASTATVTVAGGSSFDPVFEVYSNCNGTRVSTCVDYDTNNGGIETEGLSSLTVGNTYLIRVYDYAGGTGTFNICVVSSASSNASNDACGNAITLTASASCNYTTASNIGATMSGFLPCGNFFSPKDVWYKFTATATTMYINMAGQGSFDAGFEVLDACSGNSLACVDSTGGGAVEMGKITGLTTNQTYFIRAYESFGGTGAFGICVYSAQSAASSNDDCSNATALTVNGTNCNMITGSTNGATQTYTGCSGNADDDVWYKFTPTYGKMAVYVQGQAGFDPVIQLFTACNPSAGQACKNATGVGGSEIIQSNVTIGATYYVRVYDAGTGSNSSSFSICAYNDPSVGIAEEAVQGAEVLVYPNPTSASVNMVIGSTDKNAKVVFVNTQGQIIKEFSAQGSNALNTFDISDVAKGIYFVQCVSSEGVTTKRLLVE